MVFVCRANDFGYVRRAVSKMMAQGSDGDFARGLVWVAIVSVSFRVSLCNDLQTQ